jgi:hypothetical protein
MDKRRIWGYRVSVTICAGLMVASFLLPWWSSSLDIMSRNKEPIKIYAYGMTLWRDTPQEVRLYLAKDITPARKTELALGYLGASAGLVLLSAWLTGSTWYFGDFVFSLGRHSHDMGFTSCRNFRNVAPRNQRHYRICRRIPGSSNFNSSFWFLFGSRHRCVVAALSNFPTIFSGT